MDMQSSSQEPQDQMGLSTVARYTLGGLLIGVAFPLGATLIDIAVSGLPLGPRSVALAQAGQPLHWIIDTAPLVLATAGWLLGKRQEDAERLSAGLESRVAERTAQLTANTARLEAVAEVGSFVTQARDLDSMLTDVVDLIVDRFDIYHAQVFLIDDSGRLAALRASTGDPGKVLLARRHQLEVGSRSVIGQVTSKGEPVIALDTDRDTVHRANQLLPNTRSEMALALKVGERMVGALDLQSVEVNAFEADDVPVFQTMADQLAVAIDNVRLFERAQQSLREVEALNRQLTGEAWIDYLDERGGDKPLGYRAGAGGLQPVDEADSGSQPTSGEVSDEVTRLPISVRGQTIGSLDVESPSGEALDDDMKAVLEAVAERVAFALDNTRLAQEAQRTAQIQQLINMFSEQLQRTTELRAILRLTASEASKMLGAQSGFVQLEARETNGGHA